jgi:hypothetical protein
MFSPPHPLFQRFHLRRQQPRQTGAESPFRLRSSTSQHRYTRPFKYFAAWPYCWSAPMGHDAGVPPAIQQGLSENHRHLAMLPDGWLDGNFDVLAQGGEKVHKALDREVAGLPAHETGNVRLLDT